ncbi:MAG: transposase domain-containing protein [Acetobacteraceae bacterium]
MDHLDDSGAVHRSGAARDTPAAPPPGPPAAPAGRLCRNGQIRGSTPHPAFRADCVVAWPFPILRSDPLIDIRSPGNPGNSTHEQRGYYRHLYAKPILKRLQKAFLTLKHSPWLEGALEGLFRHTKLGRKNWIALGHPNAGWRYAVLYTVLETCKLLRVNPEAYLHWLLPQLACGTNRTTAHELLPHDFAALFPEHVLPERPHYGLPASRRLRPT